MKDGNSKNNENHDNHTCKLSVKIPVGVSPNLRAPPGLKILVFVVKIWLWVLCYLHLFLPFELFQQTFCEAPTPEMFF